MFYLRMETSLNYSIMERFYSIKIVLCYVGFKTSIPIIRYDKVRFLRIYLRKSIHPENHKNCIVEINEINGADFLGKLICPSIFF